MIELTTTAAMNPQIVVGLHGKFKRKTGAREGSWERNGDQQWVEGQNAQRRNWQREMWEVS
ncbi:MAG TPA: hypothetical protein VKQ11_06615 [Candidatus Sulfotelmatobacter sp.]|nr:hypothetical protein [Candidatus Sulfotelmatobacter sp.]